MAPEFVFALEHGCGKQTPSAGILLVGYFSTSINRTNVDSQWNPVYKAFHRIVAVETTQFISSSPNVILTRKTCSQR